MIGFSLHKSASDWEIGNTRIILLRELRGWKIHTAHDRNWMREHGFINVHFATRKEAYRAALAAFSINMPAGERSQPVDLIRVNRSSWRSPDHQWRVDRTNTAHGRYFVSRTNKHPDSMRHVSTLRNAAHFITDSIARAS